MLRKISAILAFALALQACSAASRLAEVGQTPNMTPISNPGANVGTGPYQVPMPMQAVRDQRRQTNSLWNANAPSFFEGRRAAQRGDIVTININIADSAQVQNSTNRSRTSAEDSDLSSFFGADLTGIFNDNIDPTSLTSLGSTSSTEGSGSVNRNESISLTLAAIVVNVLPNGTLVLAGSQEVRVNNEVRELTIQGLARPEDISADNTIEHTQIAEARISYGGRGHITEVQRPRYGQELYDLLMPF